VERDESIVGQTPAEDTVLTRTGILACSKRYEGKALNGLPAQQK
jgi:hypothetical protein